MEKLIQFIEYRYTMASFWGADAEKMLDQAFGALEFYHTEHPDQFDECEKLWNDVWHPKFLALVYGGDVNA